MSNFLFRSFHRHTVCVCVYAPWTASTLATRKFIDSRERRKKDSSGRYTRGNVMMQSSKKLKKIVKNKRISPVYHNHKLLYTDYE
jgi:hypothetical protein